jgi:hypothetical protein
VVLRPIDFGMVISKIAEGRYRTIQDVIDDVELLAANCKTYWSRFRKQSDVTVRSNMPKLIVLSALALLIFNITITTVIIFTLERIYSNGRAYSRYLLSRCN